MNAKATAGTVIPFDTDCKDGAVTWCVVPHSERRVPTGRGYVVRRFTDGVADDQFNYGGIAPVRVYRRESAAQRFANRLYDGLVAL